MIKELYTIYTSEGCPFSAAAKRLLRKHGIPYSEYDLDTHISSLIEDVIVDSGMNTTPIIYDTPFDTVYGERNEKLLGGFIELHNHLIKKHGEEGMDQLKRERDELGLN